ncbi:hypothetical protein FOMPIDRAFT_162673, partial [Fomitopsis schrenkii]
RIHCQVPQPHPLRSTSCGGTWFYNLHCHHAYRGRPPHAHAQDYASVFRPQPRTRPHLHVIRLCYATRSSRLPPLSSSRLPVAPHQRQADGCPAPL